MIEGGEGVMVEGLSHRLGLSETAGRVIALELEKRGLATCQVVDNGGGEQLILTLTVQGKARLCRLDNGSPRWSSWVALWMSVVALACACANLVFSLAR